jgi:hypothetical protein
LVVPSSPVAVGNGDELEEVALEDVSDFDPPPGDGQEGATRLGNATDGDPTTTAWASETYEGAAGAALNGKPGVGLILDPGEEVRAAEVGVTTPMPGWEAEVYATSEETPPATLAEWKSVSSPTAIDQEETTLTIEGLKRYRYYLLWITELAPAIGEEEGDSYRVEISDLRLLG